MPPDLCAGASPDGANPLRPRDRFGVPGGSEGADVVDVDDRRQPLEIIGECDPPTLDLPRPRRADFRVLLRKLSRAVRRSGDEKGRVAGLAGVRQREPPAGEPTTLMEHSRRRPG